MLIYPYVFTEPQSITPHFSKYQSVEHVQCLSNFPEIAVGELKSEYWAIPEKKPNREHDRGYGIGKIGIEKIETGFSGG